MTETDHVYHLGVSDQELDRLGFQHQAWQDITLKLWTLAGFDYGQTLLDLGCGPGFASQELARLVGDQGQVHALDASRRFIDYLGQCARAGGVRNLAVHRGDVRAIELEDQSMDGIFARWLMCFVDDPLQVCREAERLLKPGGVLVAWDYFNYSAVRVFPEQPHVKKLFDCYYQSSFDHGGSYDVAQFLPQMMHDSGLEVIHLEPINRAARPGSLTWRWVSLFHDSYLPKLVEQGLMSSSEANAFRNEWSDLEQQPGAFFFSPPMLGIIARKPL